MTQLGRQYDLAAIGLVSGLLALFYAASLKGHNGRISGLPLLIQTIIRAPQLIAPVKILQGHGHRYVARLDFDAIDDVAGRSALILLENGKPLRHPYTLSGREIEQLGEGRYVHRERKIHFSPSDNADLRTENRRYAVLESPSLDVAKIDELGRLNARRKAYANTGAWMLEKLRVLCGEMLQIGEVEVPERNALTLHQAELDLSAHALGQLRAGRMTLTWPEELEDGWNRLAITATDLSMAGSPPFQLPQLEIAFRNTGEVRLDSILLRSGVNELLNARLVWSAETLNSAGIAVNGLAALRALLIRSCGDVDACSRWLRNLLTAIRRGDLSFNCGIDEAAETALLDAFLPDGRATALHLALERRDDGLVLTAHAV